MTGLTMRDFSLAKNPQNALFYGRSSVADSFLKNILVNRNHEFVSSNNKDLMYDNLISLSITSHDTKYFSNIVGSIVANDDTAAKTIIIIEYIDSIIRDGGFVPGDDLFELMVLIDSMIEKFSETTTVWMSAMRNPHTWFNHTTTSLQYKDFYQNAPNLSDIIINKNYSETDIIKNMKPGRPGEIIYFN